MSSNANLPTPVPGVMFQALDDGAVLFSPATELYFGLNHVGARLWELLAIEDGDLEGLCARLHGSYPDVDLATLSRDVRELIGRLTTEGLVTAPSSSA